jgi:hypothetical protein
MAFAATKREPDAPLVRMLSRPVLPHVSGATNASPQSGARGSPMGVGLRIMVEDVRVGSRVGVRFGSEVRAAEVIEDRGSLGPGGERLLRVRLNMPADAEDEAFEIEVPLSWLLPAPGTAGSVSSPADRPAHRPRRRDIGRKPTLA